MVNDKKHKHSHFIPSPFQAVTEYETEFAEDGKKYIANNMVELLQYVAKTTVTVIKQDSINIK